MPRLRDTKPTAKSALQLAADRQLEENMELVGIGPRALAAERARMLKLVTLTRPFTPKERAEWKRTVRRRQRRVRADKRTAQRLANAKRTFAARSSDAAWVERWERLAADSRRIYGSAATAETTYTVWVLRGGKKGERKRQAKRARDIAKEEAKRAARRERHATAKVTPPEGMSPIAHPAPRPAPAQTVAPPAALEAAPRRRPRIKYGVVRVDDADGNRVF